MASSQQQRRKLYRWPIGGKTRKMTTNRWLMVATLLLIAGSGAYLTALSNKAPPTTTKSAKSQPDKSHWLVLGGGGDDGDDGDLAAEFKEESLKGEQEESFSPSVDEQQNQAKRRRFWADLVVAAAQERTLRTRKARSALQTRASRSERRPILNEFSFPPNLVQGMRFVLMCQVLDGDGPVQIKWFKEGRELGLASSLTGSAPDAQMEPELVVNEELGASSLLFRRVQAQQAGNYTCLAANGHGSSSYSSQMSVKVPPKWRVEPQDGHSIMGEQMSIDCQAIGNPNPFIRWKFQHLSQATSEARSNSQLGELIDQRGPEAASQGNFKLINSNHHVQALENGSLSIRQASREHEGLYLCEADNGVEPSLVKVVRLSVHQRAAFLDDLQLLVGGQPQQIDPLMMDLAGLKPSSSSPLAPGGSGSGGQPVTRAVRLPTTAANSSSAAAASAQVRLVCQPLGDLPLTLDWLKDGQLIYTHTVAAPSNGVPDGPEHEHQELPGLANGRLHVTTTTNAHRRQVQSELLLVALRRQDAGTYTCAARNQFGRAERQLRLLLQEPPEPPQLLDVGHIGSRSVTLRWLAPYDGNNPILRYLVEYRKLDSPQDDTSGATSSSSSYTWSESQPASGHSERLMASGGGQVPLPLVAMGQQVQHTVHELEPLTRYSMRVVAINGLARSRPSAAIGLRTEEEVPSVVPSMVETVVLGSSLIRLRWTISYSAAHEIIDGFFVGYRSLESSPGAGLLQNPSSKQPPEQPTFTYKTIRLTNQQQQHQNSKNIHQLAEEQSSALLSPISSFTKTLTSPAPFNLPSSSPSNSQQQQQVQAGQLVVVVSAFEYEIGGLERNTEYTILIQCFNKKGAGPTSDPVVFRTLVNDPPDKLALSTEEITESSIKISWRFLSPSPRLAASNLISTGRAQRDQAAEQPVDGFVLTYVRLEPNNNLSNRHNGFNKDNDIRQAAARISQLAANSNSKEVNMSSTKKQPGLDQWQAVQLAPQQRSHQLRALDCGTAYAMKIWAFNKVGNGEPSDLITVATRGKAPVAPDKRSFISINSTQVRLHLSAWYDGGCELDKFVLQYRQRGQQEWLLVSNNILKEQMSVVIRDLLPATGYELLVVAHNQVGPTEVRYRFATLDQDGRQVQALGPPLDGNLEDGDEYLEEDNNGVRREHWHDLTNHKSLAFFRHLLGSPWALMLSLSLFLLLCLLLLAVYKFSPGAASHQNDPMAQQPSLHQMNKHKQDSSDGELAPPSVGAINGSSLGDSPHLPLSSQFPLINECQYQSYCGQPQVQAQTSVDYGRVMANDLYLASTSNNTTTGDYGAATYASVQRPTEETQQQCLMQMLMMGSGGQQNQSNQLEQANYAAALGTLARGTKAMQQHYGGSYTATLRPSSQLMQQATYHQRLTGGTNLLDAASTDSNNKPKPTSSNDIAMNVLATATMPTRLLSSGSGNGGGGGSTSSGASTWTSGFNGSGSCTTTSDCVCDQTYNQRQELKTTNQISSQPYNSEPSKSCDTSKPSSPYDVPFKKNYT